MKTNTIIIAILSFTWIMLLSYVLFVRKLIELFKNLNRKDTENERQD